MKGDSKRTSGNSLSLLRAQPGGRGGGGVLGVNFCWVCATGLSSPYPIIVYSVAKYRPHLSLFGQICSFRNLCNYLINSLNSSSESELTHFSPTVKTSGKFANRRFKCDPVLVTLLKVRPHYSQSSRENVTPSSGTSPLASCKEVPRPLPPPTRASQTLLTDVKLRLSVGYHQPGCEQQCRQLTTFFDILYPALKSK